jgi:Ice-binding-like
MRIKHMFKTVAVVSILSLAACGSCNCSVPGFTAGSVAGPIGVPTTAPTTFPTTGPGGVPTTAPTTVPTTVPAAPVMACNQGAGALSLGAALTPFALLAGSTVTNTGLTNVTFAAGATTGSFNDDLIGVSPGTAVVGFYPPGTDADGPAAIYAVGAGFSNQPAVTLAAQSALTTAYNNFAGVASTVTFPGGQDLSQASVPGHPIGTLPAGVYASASSMGILAGNLTLDGGGNPQSVFIFQAGSTLTTTLNGPNSGNVNLINGASACNIYWQVGSSAVLGAQSFSGNVLALGSITLTSATQFTGRALARTGAVTISIASLITNPGGK